jgi:hypothetical protein
MLRVCKFGCHSSTSRHCATANDSCSMSDTWLVS